MSIRNDAMDALFAKMQTLSGTFPTIEPRLRYWKEVAKPALFLSGKGHETFNHTRGLPNLRTVYTHIVVMDEAATGSTTDATVPAKALNLLIEQVEALFAQDDYAMGGCTLGGKVFDCWISNIPDKEPGDLDGQSMAVIEVAMMLP